MVQHRLLLNKARRTNNKPFWSFSISFEEAKQYRRKYLNVLRSAFYGGRIASAMTIGAATKLIRGASHAAHHHKGKGDSGSKNDSNEKYVEEKSESTDKEGLTV